MEWYVVHTSCLMTNTAAYLTFLCSHKRNVPALSTELNISTESQILLDTPLPCEVDQNSSEDVDGSPTVLPFVPEGPVTPKTYSRNKSAKCLLL